MLCAHSVPCVAGAAIHAEDYRAPPLGVSYARQEFVARTDPDPESPIRAVLPRGFEVKIVSESEDHRWYWVSLADGINAWVPKEELVNTQPEEPPSVETVLTANELRRFHHILALDTIYSFNFNAMVGKTMLKPMVGRAPTTYGAFEMGPGVGQRLGLQNPVRNFLFEAKLLLARETFIFPETTGEGTRGVISAGSALDVRYLWIHNLSTAGGLYAGINLMYPINYDDLGLNAPSILSFRTGVSVSVEIPGALGAMIFDLGASFRGDTTSFGFASSLVF